MWKLHPAQHIETEVHMSVPKQATWDWDCLPIRPRSTYGSGSASCPAELLRTHTFLHACRVNTRRRRRTTHPAASRGHRVRRHGVISVVAAMRDRLSLQIKAYSYQAQQINLHSVVVWSACRTPISARPPYRFPRRAAAGTRTTWCRRRRRTHGLQQAVVRRRPTRAVIEQLGRAAAHTFDGNGKMLTLASSTLQVASSSATGPAIAG